MIGVVEQVVEMPNEPLPPVEPPKKSKKLMMLAGVASVQDANLLDCISWNQ